MTVFNLVEKFESFFDHKCRSKNKRYLICRILRRLQASVEIGLSERGIKNAIMLALDAEVRVKSPREPKTSSVVIVEVPFKWFRDMRFLPLVQYFIETSTTAPPECSCCDTDLNTEGNNHVSTVLANRIWGHLERLVKAFTLLPKPILGKTPELA